MSDKNTMLYVNEKKGSTRVSVVNHKEFKVFEAQSKPEVGLTAYIKMEAHDKIVQSKIDELLRKPKK